MINAGLHIFAMNGYRHASTDEIVQEAKISKGLLFHYFGSKAGYYAFLYNYISRYVILELRSSIRNAEMDYFALQNEILNVESGLMNAYPFVFLFFESVKMEEDGEALNSLEELDDSVPSVYDRLLSAALVDHYPRVREFDKISEIIHFIKIGLMRETLDDPSVPLSVYTGHVREYLDVLQDLCRE